MLLPQHHETSLAVPMGGETATGTPEGSPLRLMRTAALRAVATSAPFPDETRCDTRLSGLVSEVVFDPPGLHLRNLLGISG